MLAALQRLKMFNIVTDETNKASSEADVEISSIFQEKRKHLPDCQ